MSSGKSGLQSSFFFIPGSPSGWQRRELLITIVLILLQLTPDVARAQFNKLFDFGGAPNGTNPYSALISDGTFLYGTTVDGGANGGGTIYKIKPDGTGFVNLFDFDDDSGYNSYGSLFFDGTFLYGMANQGGADGHGTIFKIKPDGTGFVVLLDLVFFPHGAFPYGGLISDGTFLYGMTSQGGTGFDGTLFKIKTDGSAFSKVVEFDGANGSQPFASLIYDGTFLYGMTNGGFTNNGNAFKVKPDGTGFTTLLTFNGPGNGSKPLGSFFSDGTFLYGMTYQGGLNNFGTIFKIKPDATGFVKLVDFDNSAKGAYPTGTLVSDGTFLYGMNNDFGANHFGEIFKVDKVNGATFTKLLDNDVSTGNVRPEGTLLFVGSTLYGVRSGLTGGFVGFLPGTIFKINTDGSAYTKLFYFEIEGNQPSGSLFSDGTFQYGMTSSGGIYNFGIIFKIKPDGTGFVKLLDFDGATHGQQPSGSLISDGTFLYGMTSGGGSGGGGTIFKIKPDGTGYVKLLDFDYTNNGGGPGGDLLYDGTFLYGMTAHGGTGTNGTIFKILPNGTGYIKLVDLNYTNNGAYPNGSLYSDGTFLYGMTFQGGTNGGWGTVFKVKTDGTLFAKLLDFDNTNTGGNPGGSFVSDGTFLYGLTSSGGLNSVGTIFKIKFDGTGYAKLLDFDENTSGSYPNGSLLSDGTFLYGLTSSGGVSSKGTMFKIRLDGTGYAKLLDFNDGSSAQGSLNSDGTFLYGMTQSGGAYSTGTLFKSTKTAFVSIADFVPSDGVVGTYVTIDGTNFDPTPANNIVKFNNTPAKVISASATTLVAVVPAGATTGPITVTTSTTGTSTSDFDVTTDATMFNGTVQNCNVQFISGGLDDNDITETFLPANSGDKVKASFSSFHIGDILYVYDGPNVSSPLLTTLHGFGSPVDIVATRPGGELTFLFSWQDDTSDWAASISCQSPTGSITIDIQPAAFAGCPGSTATFTTSASGTSNITYQWQYSTTLAGTYNDIANGGGYSNAATSTLSVNTTGNFGVGFYRCKVNGDLAATVFSNAVQLTVALPSAPVGSGVNVCNGASTTLTVSGGVNGQYNWYTVPASGTAITGQHNSSITTPVLTITTTYYVSITNVGCESLRTSITATILPCVPVIANAPLATQIGGKITLNLIPLITTANNNLDLTSLKVLTPPSSGATATIDVAGVLTIDYNGKNFSGVDQITIKACDTNGNCATQMFNIDVAGEIVVFNGISPDGANPVFIIQYIDAFPDTKNNKVSIFDRWENLIWQGSNYNNTSVVFSGTSNGGSALPSGVYFYKIEFVGGRKTMTGFISLRRQ